MSLRQRWEWACDGCGTVVPDAEGARQEGDVLMPEGWIHTMMGDDLCQECVPVSASTSRAEAQPDDCCAAMNIGVDYDEDGHEIAVCFSCNTEWVEKS